MAPKILRGGAVPVAKAQAKAKAKAKANPKAKANSKCRAKPAAALRKPAAALREPLAWQARYPYAGLPCLPAGQRFPQFLAGPVPVPAGPVNQPAFGLSGVAMAWAARAGVDVNDFNPPLTEAEIMDDMDRFQQQFAWSDSDH
jgi:hypothetical protein